MFGGGHHSSDDLFDLVWRGGARGQEAQPNHRLSSPSPPAVVVQPPPEDDMMAWFNPTVSGQEAAVVAGHDDHQTRDVAGHAAAEDHKREMRPPKVEERWGAEDSSHSTKRYSSGRSWKKAKGGASRSHHAETHNLAEKRRRCKINEKLKTLQHLVPGCDDKTNQASTLDQTIQYIKSLQQQIQAMSFGCGGMNSKPPPAAYPFVPSPYLPPGTGVSAGGLLPPPASFAPAVPVMMAARGHVVRPGVVLAPAPAPPPAMMVPFGPLLPPVHHAPAPSCCCGHGAPGRGCSKCIYGWRQTE